jgi:deazaflavin-dependent oxidoreductase (nitroreductase family)
MARALNPSERRKRRRALMAWKVINPLARSLAGIAPWWVVLETRGHRSGRPRRVPLARGPVDGNTAWVISVHGDHSAHARNVAADPDVRLKLRGRWREGTTELVPIDEAVLRRFNRYARLGPRTMGIEPKLMRIELAD